MASVKRGQGQTGVAVVVQEVVGHRGAQALERPEHHRRSILEPADRERARELGPLPFQAQRMGQLCLPRFEHPDVLLELSEDEIASVARFAVLLHS
jgi:hypothetical protein